MISMPWSTTVDFRDEPVKFQSNNSSWGASGSVDTGWLTVGSESTGSSTTIVPHPPGASIENMTFEIGVNGSLGICAQDPILTLVDANQEILMEPELVDLDANKATRLMMSLMAI